MKKLALVILLFVVGSALRAQSTEVLSVRVKENLTTQFTFDFQTDSVEIISYHYDFKNTTTKSVVGVQKWFNHIWVRTTDKFHMEQMLPLKERHPWLSIPQDPIGSANF